MSDHASHSATDHGTAHAGAGHGDAHDDHGHAADTLGPIDVRMWGVGIVGVIVALVVAAGFVAATSFVFGA
jgi:ABC-type Zn2+ transport system substrate-binding protein/surface adhesin